MHHEGWEPHAEVINRFAVAVARHAALAARESRLLVVGTHGLSATVWLASRITLKPDAALFWEQLRFPDLVDVDLIAGTASRRVG